MASASSKPRGRPRRAAIEPVRTIWWYWTVRLLSGLSESKLEAKFDQIDRKRLGLHRSTRWNKYKFGRSTPSVDLLEAVDAIYPGTRQAYDHNLWSLAANPHQSVPELFEYAKSLPTQIRCRLLPDRLLEGCEFWLRQDTDLSKLCEELSNPLVDSGSIADVVCTFVLLARLAIHLQDEDLHFNAHRAIAKVATWRHRRDIPPVVSLLVANLICAWINTKYRDPTKYVVLIGLRKVREGPPPPWLSEQAALDLSVSSEKRTAYETDLARHYWVALQLAT